MNMIRDLIYKRQFMEEGKGDDFLVEKEQRSILHYLPFLFLIAGSGFFLKIDAFAWELIDEDDGVKIYSKKDVLYYRHAKGRNSR